MDRPPRHRLRSSSPATTATIAICHVCCYFAVQHTIIALLLYVCGGGGQKFDARVEVQRWLGDEYEGQIALHKLCRGMDPTTVQGRIIVVPTLSMDAALGGTRTWPDADRTNFNRRFPGTPTGSVAAQLAYYIRC